jgi:hypothetical protein
MRILWALAVSTMLFAIPARAQFVPGAQIGGVAISTDGVLQYRQVAPIQLPTTANRKGQQLYVSLPRAIEAWKAAKEAGKEVPADVKYLQGLTQIRQVFIFPEQHDIVVAGPSEPYKATNTVQPLGTQTGRPVVHLEDIIVAMRAVSAPRGGRGAGGSRFRDGDFFGCSLEPPANLADVWEQTLKRYERGPRNVLVAEMKKALGPQEVKLYGVPEDSRVAWTMLAADYRLKRVAMGLDIVPGLGSALGTENAAPRIWFEPAYEALQVSPEGDAFEFRGPRLKVLVGSQPFNPQGASDAQRRFAENLSKKMPDAAARLDAFADLQNITDCFMVAALIRSDRLAEKAGLPADWLPAANAPFLTETLPVPRTAETVVHVAGNVIAQGGVAFGMGSFNGVERTTGGPTAISAKPQRPVETWYMAIPTGN